MADSSFDPGSRSRLTRRDLTRFTGSTLFDRVARVVCEAECLPRKELYEAWEVARRTRRRMRGGRIIDLACGHGLVAHLMLILDDTSPEAIGVDRNVPPSAARLAAAIATEWPRTAGRVSIVRGSLEDVGITARVLAARSRTEVPVAGTDGSEAPREPMTARVLAARSRTEVPVAGTDGSEAPREPTITSTDLVVAVHACGRLTDVVLDHVIAARARVSFMACCHDAAACDMGSLEGWLPPAIAIDATRVLRLRSARYDVHTQRVPEAITPENRLVLASPR